jgi:competence protein ComEA
MSRRRLALLALVLSLAGCGLFRRGGDDADERARPVAIDLNTASLRKIEALPGITPSMAKRIVEGRPYGDTDALVEKGILTERELERIRDHVEVPEAR